MTESDLYTLKENYINHIIDGMDIDTLCAYAFDAMMNGTDGISQWDEVDVTEEIKDLYDEGSKNIKHSLVRCKKEEPLTV